MEEKKQRQSKNKNTDFKQGRVEEKEHRNNRNNMFK